MALIDNILGATSSRSGTSTSSSRGSSTATPTASAQEKPQTYTFPDGSSVSLTPSQYAQTPFPKWLDIYNQCYKIANSRNLTSPKWSDIQQFGDAVLQAYQSGKAFDANAYKAQLEASQKKTYTLPDGSQRQLTKAEYDSLIAAYNEYQAAQYAAYQAEQQAKAAAEAAAKQAAAEKAAAEAAAEAAAQQAAAEKAAAEKAAAEAALESEYLELCNAANQHGIINLPAWSEYKKLSVSERNILKNDYLRMAIESYGLVDIPGWKDFLKLSDSEKSGLRMVVAAKKQRETATPPEVVLPSTIPAGVQPIDTTEDQGSGFPWLAAALFAAIGIGAIALSKSKPKKKRR